MGGGARGHKGASCEYQPICIQLNQPGDYLVGRQSRKADHGEMNLIEERQGMNDTNNYIRLCRIFAFHHIAEQERFVFSKGNLFIYGRHCSDDRRVGLDKTNEIDLEHISSCQETQTRL